MGVLNLTPPERLVDAAGRPYFLWDMDLTLEAFCARLVDPDADVRTHFLAKLMRQARPDDVLALVGTRALREAWPNVRAQLGDKHDFWAWWLRRPLVMSPRDSLSAIQRQVLVALAGLEPRWTLSGGGALAGFYLGHRATRDVDLFFRGATTLGRVGDDAERELRARGFEAHRLVTAPAFVQLRVEVGGEVVLVDLVADPVATIEPSVTATLDGVSVEVDSMHELLVNKLCALLGRAEVRDLVDVSAILAAGGDLERAVSEAPRKDAGFSPLTLAWLLARYPAARLATAYGVDPDHAERLRAALEERLVALARREAEPSEGER